MTDFRLCWTCLSRSQAGLCHCTQQLISDQLEPTFARLRYSLGGDRPSQTTHHAGSRAPWGAAVRYQNIQKRYFTDDSIPAGAGTSKSPAYATYERPNTTAKL